MDFEGNNSFYSAWGSSGLGVTRHVIHITTLRPLGPTLPTGHSNTAARFYTKTTLPTVPILSQLISIYPDPLRNTLLAKFCNRRRREAICHQPAIDNLHRSLLHRDICLGPMVEQCLNVNGNLVGVWCVPSAA
jgi:hypothetical protein